MYSIFIYNNTIDNNQAGSYGGGIVYMTYYNNQDTDVSNNDANVYGGGYNTGGCT